MENKNTQELGNAKKENYGNERLQTTFPKFHNYWLNFGTWQYLRKYE